nr:hypothetical protein [Pandoravirus belohorizontensis]
MGSRRGHCHRRLQPAEQRAQAFVLVGLPIEVWGLVVGWCDIDDVRTLTRTCAALRRCAWARMDAGCRATHASVDAFVALWERETSRGDRLFGALSCSRCGKRHIALSLFRRRLPRPRLFLPFFLWRVFLWCHLFPLVRRGPSACAGFFICSFIDSFFPPLLAVGAWRRAGPRWDADDYSDGDDDDDKGDNDPASKGTAALPVKWRAYATLPPYGRDYTAWLCDVCGRRARARAERAGSGDNGRDDDNDEPEDEPSGVQVPDAVQEIDVDRPHVWSTHGRLADADLVYADHVADVNFVVPACVAHLLDARPFAWLVSHGVGKPEARGRNNILARIGSIRGWMPLRRRACVWTGRPGCTRRSVLMVCCDAANPMWGAVAVVHLHHRRRLMYWYEAEPSLTDLMARWREHPLRLFDALYATAWMEWAIATYVDAAHHADRQRARTHAVCDQHALDAIADSVHVASGRPWAGLLRPDEYLSFFDEHDAIDAALDDDLCSGAAPRRQRRCRRTKRRRPIRS